LKIALVIPTMNLGGAERVFATLAAHWVSLGHQVSLLLFSGENVETFFNVDRRVTTECLNVLGEPNKGPMDYLRLAVSRVRELRRHLKSKRPDVIISALPAANFAAAVAGWSLGIPAILTEHSATLDIQRQPYKAIMFVAYAMAKRIVVLDESIRASLPRWMQRRTVIIPNPLTVDLGRLAETKQSLDSQKGRIVTLGRLHSSKGFEFLIAAFSSLAGEYPGWGLTIFGEGPERTALEKMVADLGMSDRIFLPGPTRDVSRVIAEADIFVSSARTESWGVALHEALAVGVAVIVAASGKRALELVEYGQAGLVVPIGDINALRNAMLELIRSPGLRQRLAERGKISAERYSVANVSREWDKNFIECGLRRRVHE
jgi:glycosyltransferase involved in cell wall biosynthesis